MHSLLHQADTFQTLLKHTDHGLPFRFETIFKDETRKDRRASKKKLKLLRAIVLTDRQILLLQIHGGDRPEEGREPAGIQGD